MAPASDCHLTHRKVHIVGQRDGEVSQNPAAQTYKS